MLKINYGSELTASQSNIQMQALLEAPDPKLDRQSDEGNILWQQRNQRGTCCCSLSSQAADMVCNTPCKDLGKGENNGCFCG